MGARQALGSGHAAVIEALQRLAAFGAEVRLAAAPARAFLRPQALDLGVGVPLEDAEMALAQAGVTSLIPVIQTREMESVLRVQSGQVAVLGGLMQDAVSNIEDTIPGVRDIPGVGALLSQRKDLNQKTELVIFLRPVVIKEASIDGDYAGYRNLLPGADFFSKPNPSRTRPAPAAD